MRVCVVGGGCGGCATSYYIHKQLSLRDDVEIVLYERSSLIGGRLRHTVVEDDDLTVELGGNIFHEQVNPNLVSLRREVQTDLVQTRDEDKLKYLETYNPYSDIKSSGIFNGKGFDIIMGESSLLRSWKEWLDQRLRFSLGISSLLGCLNSVYKKISIPFTLITRYGLSSLTRTKNYQKRGVKVINNLFNQNHIDEYSHLVDQYFPGALFTACRSVMQKELGVSRNFVSEILESVSRNIYSQSLDDYHQMAMITTLMAGDDRGLKAFTNGNSNFFRTAFEMIGERSTLHLNSIVAKIVRRDDGKFLVTSVKNNSDDHRENVELFDIVVICTPLEVAEIEMENIDLASDLIQNRDFVGCHIAIVRGEVNPNFFGFKYARDVPQLIRTTQEAESKNDFNLFISFQNLWKNARNQKIYKIQSREKLTTDDFNKLFLKTDYIFQTYFPIAYPMLRVLTQQEKLYTKICPGLYYNNTVETVSSAMEASCWAAKNVASLIASDTNST